jgi:hypothetical protein
MIALSAIAQSGPKVLAPDDLKKVAPEAYFFRGMSATTRLRNSAAIRYPDDFYVMAGLVDMSGYSSDVKAKYNGFFIAKRKLRFDGGAMLAPGQYGMLARPHPLKIVMDGATKLYLGKKYVSFTAQ